MPAQAGTPKVSEAVLAKFKAITEQKKIQSDFMKFDDGKAVMLYIDPEKFEMVIDRWDKEGKKKKVAMKVADLTSDSPVKNWEVSLSFFEQQLMPHMKQGFKLFQITRTGTGNSTKYSVIPHQG